MVVRSEESRRSALSKLVSAGLGLITAGLAGLVGLVAAPKASATTRRWRAAASIFDLPPKDPFTAVLADKHADGWYETRKEQVVFIDREGDGYRAMSATCAHLGCRVRWESSRQQFLCPCHGGVYDATGQVVSGPPPAPLTVLETRVDTAADSVLVRL